jgi:hypothetical protein
MDSAQSLALLERLARRAGLAVAEWAACPFVAVAKPCAYDAVYQTMTPQIQSFRHGALTRTFGLRCLGEIVGARPVSSV